MCSEKTPSSALWLRSARQELWEPLPDVTEHWPCLFQASNQHISPRDADSACAAGARRFLGMTEPLGGDAANSAYPRDKAGVVLFTVPHSDVISAPALPLLH